MTDDRRDHESKNQMNAEEGQADLLAHDSYEELMNKLGEAEKKADQYFERLLRMQAEGENAQRRSERDITNAHKYALEKFVGELIPIIDSLELCTVNAPKDLQEQAKSIMEGVNLTLRMFYTAMDKFGIKQVNPVKEAFNPEFQQAISMQFDPDVAPGSVISVLQKGYTLNNRLIRPALVVVAKAKE